MPDGERVMVFHNIVTNMPAVDVPHLDRIKLPFERNLLPGLTVVLAPFNRRAILGVVIVAAFIHRQF